MKTSLIIGICATTLGLASVTAYISLKGHAQAEHKVEAAPMSRVQLPSHVLQSETKSVVVQIPANKYSEALQASKSYLDFANSTIRDAESGNRDAQYFLGKALRFCDATYSMYFERKGQVLTLDEALMWAARLSRSGAYVQRIYDRCHELKEHYAKEFRKSSDWIEEAANAGQPAALAMLALQGFSDNTAPPSKRSSTAGGDPMADFRANLRAAVESKDPEVLWQIGLAQGFLNTDFAEKVKNQLAWWLVSCQRGYDCSAQADWLALDCPDESFCTPGISGIDYIRNGSGADWPEIQVRAQEINAKLDAGRWPELGLDM